MGMMCKIVASFFLLFFAMHCYAATEDCNTYNNYSKEIFNSNEPDEIKLIKLYKFTKDNNIQCESFRSDLMLLRRRFFSYQQNGELIPPHFLSLCSTIVNGDICDSQQHDGSEGVYLRYKNNFEKKPITSDTKILTSTNGYNLYMAYYNWEDVSNKKTSKIHKQKLTIENHGRYSSISIDDISKQMITTNNNQEDNHYSQAWLSIIYKKNDSDFIKVVWYY